MVGVTLFAVGTSLDSMTRQAPSTTTTHSVVRDYFRAQPPPGEIDYVRWLSLLKVDASSTASDPVGGGFDYDPVEFAKGPGAPR